MKTIVPDYYPRFSCIAGACRHSCCIGWEIDIDSDALRRYQQQEGSIGQRLRQNIEMTPDGACFRLSGPEERCPFLNASGLCDLILTLGEDALCQICTDHPRFRNFYADRTEMGVGLCCEAACRLILGWEEPVGLMTLEDDGETETADPKEARLLSVRDSLIGLMQDRSRSVEARVEMLLDAAGARAEDFDWKEWLPFLRSLEQLDPQWDGWLARLDGQPCSLPVIPAALQRPMEQMMVYLLFRQLPGAVDDGCERERILLCALMWLIAARLVLDADGSVETLAEICRSLSSEWEYSEDNIAALLDEMGRLG